MVLVGRHRGDFTEKIVADALAIKGANVACHDGGGERAKQEAEGKSGHESADDPSVLHQISGRSDPMGIPEIDQTVHLAHVGFRIFHDFGDVGHQVRNQQRKIRLGYQQDDVNENQPPNGAQIPDKFVHVAPIIRNFPLGSTEEKAILDGRLRHSSVLFDEDAHDRFGADGTKFFAAFPKAATNGSVGKIDEHICDFARIPRPDIAGFLALFN